mgnify:CR=1 FL=1
MPDYPPSIYASHFEIGESYSISLRRMSETQTGKYLAELDFGPAVTLKDGEQVNTGTMWFDPPGSERHDPKDWAFYEALSTMAENVAFDAVRKGKPWAWSIGGEKLEPTTVKTPEGAPQQAASAPAAPQQAPTPQAAPVAPQRPSGAYSGPLLKDVEALRRDCLDVVMSRVGDDRQDWSDDFIHGQAACLFIAMDRHGAAKDYLKYKGLHLAGSKPADGSEGEGAELPF